MIKRKIEPNHIYCGDCLEVMRDIPDGSIDSVITDPPYGVDAAAWDGRVPHELILEFIRISRGPIVWFGSAPNVIDDARQFPIPPERMMIWAPRFTLSKIAKDGFAYRFHPIWWWNIRKQISAPWDVFTEPTEGGNWWFHKCTKPVRLIQQIITASTDPDALILDPFLGSGTTAVAALKTGRRFIGIEISPEYCAIAQKRIDLELKQPRLFFSGNERKVKNEIGRIF